MKKLIILMLMSAISTRRIYGSIPLEIESCIDSVCAEGSIGKGIYFIPCFGNQRLYSFPPIHYPKPVFPLDYETGYIKKKIVDLIVSQAQRDYEFSHVIITGPPGVGKTTLACSIINETGLEYIRS